MINIPLNASVESTDGLVGQSVCVIVKPKVLQVTHFVIKESESPHTQRLVPVDRVEETTADRIRLNCTRSQVAEMESFLSTQYTQVDVPRYVGGHTAPVPVYATDSLVVQEQHERIADDEIALCKGIPVQATDGSVGRIDELLVDPQSGTISHVILRKGHLWGRKEVILPISVVDYTDEETVYLTLDKETISSLLAIPAAWSRDGSDVELLILTLEGTGEANNALQALRDSVKAGDLQVLHAAVLVKDENGRPSIKETEDIAPGRGALFGAITGGLIGLLGGPVGVVIGAAAGAAAGGVAAGRIDMGFPDEYLQKLEEGLSAGSSALVVLVQREWVETVTEALSGVEGQLLTQELTEEAVRQLGSVSGSE